MTSTRIILESSSNWDGWLGQHKLFATTHKIWCYCNPDKDENEVIPLLKPPMPTLASLTATAQSEGSSGEQQEQQGYSTRPQTVAQRTVLEMLRTLAADGTTFEDATQTTPLETSTLPPEVQLKLWEYQNKNYTKKKSKLNEMVQRIQDTLAIEYHYLINDKETVHAMLRALRQRLSPSALERELELQAR